MIFLFGVLRSLLFSRARQGVGEEGEDLGEREEEEEWGREGGIEEGRVREEGGRKGKEMDVY